MSCLGCGYVQPICVGICGVFGPGVLDKGSDRGSA